MPKNLHESYVEKNKPKKVAKKGMNKTKKRSLSKIPIENPKSYLNIP
jgi:hypothetical protein